MISYSIDKNVYRNRFLKRNSFTFAAAVIFILIAIFVETKSDVGLYVRIVAAVLFLVVLILDFFDKNITAVKFDSNSVIIEQTPLFSSATESSILSFEKASAIVKRNKKSEIDYIDIFENKLTRFTTISLHSTAYSSYDLEAIANTLKQNGIEVKD